ncbi:hypothetical protein EUTSA_v10017369mg [Eutrema salsugineum]|uniref:Uncharacterized protein n=1 Tax=Eutrema salsugineum TaxID=72664 RepID=V4NWR7_EUTSA|nr:cyclin-dependent protein kinase inhibitor SMR11 [Eutrema salsugineum]XP_024004299.1 cyclin-dependent protein kinase inhibitor SMR11 [Eutrema salsugineum]ESQ51311.1 hypothetical protein EUTSA_v10017369mg [Eutrema salsugineum]
MDKEEDPCEVKEASLEPKTSIADAPDSIPSFDSSESSLSEEETMIKSDRKIVTLSPLCNQYNDKMSIIDSNLFDCVLVSDEEIIESIYQNLLRIIVSLQIQGNGEIWCFDGCKTPPSRLNDAKMVPDTCPGAPMKLTKISRNIDSGLRRKLF